MRTRTRRRKDRPRPARSGAHRQGRRSRRTPPGRGVRWPRSSPRVGSPKAAWSPRRLPEAASPVPVGKSPLTPRSLQFTSAVSARIDLAHASQHPVTTSPKHQRKRVRPRAGGKQDSPDRHRVPRRGARAQARRSATSATRRCPRYRNSEYHRRANVGSPAGRSGCRRNKSATSYR